MKTIRLFLRDKHGQLIETIDGNFDPKDIHALHQFNTQATRACEASLAKRGVPGLVSIRLEEGEITYKGGECSDAELHELLHVLRPVILESETASFLRTASLLKQRFSNKLFSNLIKNCRNIFKHGELSLYMQIDVDGQPLLHKSLLNIRLNATQYHTDSDKYETWTKLENALEAKNARIVIVDLLQSKIKAILQLKYIVELVLKKAHSE